MLAEIVDHSFCQRHIIGQLLLRYGLRKVFVRNTQVLAFIFGRQHLKLHFIAELHFFGKRIFLAIKIDTALTYLQHLTRKSDAALHVILSAVDGSRQNAPHLALIHIHEGASGRIDATKGRLLCLIRLPAVDRSRERLRHSALLRQQLVADLVNQAIEVLILRIGRHGIARRVIEYDDVVQFGASEALHAPIIPMGIIDVTPAIEHRQRMLHQRHREWRLRNARSVRKLTYQKIIAREHRLLQRRRRDDEVLKEKLIEKVNGHQGKDDRVDPAHNFACRRIFQFLPPAPFDALRNVKVEDQGQDEQAPKTLHPIQEKQVEQRINDTLDEVFFCRFHRIFVLYVLKIKEVFHR